MSNIVFPVLASLEWGVTRRPTFQTIMRSSDSLREINSLAQVRCLYEFDLSYSALRNRTGAQDLQQLMGLFCAMRGSYDTFLFTDPDDNSANNVQIGTGNGTNLVFVLGRPTGINYFEAIGRVNQLTEVRVNGSVVPTANYSIILPNSIKFNTAPANGAVVTATFTYWFICRFMEDMQGYDQFMFNLFRLRSCKFKSVPY